MKSWRDAASLLFVVRTLIARKNNATSLAENFKVLMLRRNKESSFMPSKLVFPGGVISEADHSLNWGALYQKNANITDILDSLKRFGISVETENTYPLIKDNLHWKLHPHVAFRIGAIRETFEESGLLLAVGGNKISGLKTDNIKNNMFFDDANNIKKWRRKVHDDPSEFLNMCKDYNIVPNIWALHEWNNWLTPLFKRDGKTSARFDTIFYICCMQGDDVPTAAPDDKEMFQAHWLSPSEFIDLNSLEKNDRAVMAPPQVYELNKMKGYKHYNKLKSAVYEKNCSNTVKQRFLPLFRKCKGGVSLLLPGDYMYPVNVDLNTTVFNVKDYKTSEMAESDTNSIDHDKPLHRVVYKDHYLHDGFIIKNFKS